MDAAALGQYSGYLAIIISLGATVITIVNHKKCRSRCGQRELTASLDIGPITPPENKPSISI